MKVPIFPDFGLFRVGKWEYERILLFLKESSDFGDLGKSPSGNWNSSKRGFSILARSRDWGIPRLTLLFFSPFFRSFSAEQTHTEKRERESEVCRGARGSSGREPAESGAFGALKALFAVKARQGVK